MQIDHKFLRLIVIAALSPPFFVIASIKAPLRFNPSGMDFAIYWQAGSMNLQDKYVYDQEEWTLNVLRPGLDEWFNYPLPLAVLLTPLGLFPIADAYVAWIFFAQCSILFSVLLLLGFYKDRRPRFELIALTAVFLFRPIYTIIFSGQLDSYLLLFLVMFLYLSRREQWLWGGFILSWVCLKPSLGVFILAFMGLWVLVQKNWRAMAGITPGAFTLLLIGLIENINWVMDYLFIGRQLINKYSVLNTTIWGFSNLITKNSDWETATAIILALGIAATESYLFLGKKENMDAFSALATIIPAALIIAPYSWAYDQILLIVPIVYIAIKFSKQWSDFNAAVFLLGVDILAVILVTVAYSLKHDVWSALTSFFVWFMAVYFASSPKNY